jgi:hypothetical protein
MEVKKTLCSSLKKLSELRGGDGRADALEEMEADKDQEVDNEEPGGWAVLRV